MTTIEASKLPADALKALQAGKQVNLTRGGKAIATLRASPVRTVVTVAQARRILKQLREADRHDDWSDYIDWGLK